MVMGNVYKGICSFWSHLVDLRRTKTVGDLHSSVVYAMAVSVCLSAHLSYAGIVSKQLEGISSLLA